MYICRVCILIVRDLNDVTMCTFRCIATKLMQPTATIHTIFTHTVLIPLPRVHESECTAPVWDQTHSLVPDGGALSRRLVFSIESTPNNRQYTLTNYTDNYQCVAPTRRGRDASVTGYMLISSSSGILFANIY